MLATLCAVLAVGGLVEYLVILTFFSHWDSTVHADQLYEYDDTVLRPRHSPGNAYQMQGLEKNLERLGRERMLALAARGPMQNNDEEDESESAFYERRSSRINELIRKYEKGAYSGGALKFGGDPGGRGDILPHDSLDRSGMNDGVFQFLHELPEVDSIYGPELLVENDTSLPRRELSPFEAAGNNIMLTLRTVKNYHHKRLPLLFSTWLTKVNGSNVFLMTDGRDPVWQNRVWKRGM